MPMRILALRFFFLATLGLWFGFSTTLAQSAGVAGEASESLDPKDYRAVTFKDITPTVYELSGDSLLMNVKSSASALVHPYKEPRKIWRMRFAWKLEGSVKTSDQKQEQSKKGDDLPLRLGLIVSGPAPTVPFFAPAWIKAVADTLLHPSNRMVYFAAGAKTPAGQKWESPYASSLENRSVSGTKDSDGWEVVDASFETFDVVGLWIMADGDNTDSVFVTKLKGLRFN